MVLIPTNCCNSISPTPNRSCRHTGHNNPTSRWAGVLARRSFIGWGISVPPAEPLFASLAPPLLAVNPHIAGARRISRWCRWRSSLQAAGGAIHAVAS